MFAADAVADGHRQPEHFAIPVFRYLCYSDSKSANEKHSQL